MFAASKSGSADAKDPQFNYVTMLLHGDGTNGAQNNTFLDSSTNNFTITRNGNTTQGTFTPYGANWSNYFDGSGDRLTVPANAAFNFSTGDFTVECWFYTNSVSANQWIVGPDNTVTYPWVLQTSGSAIRFLSNNAANDFRPTSFTLTTGTWNHFAVTRSGSTMYWFTNGTLNGTQTYSTAIGSNTIDVQIGTTGSGSGDPVNGYISNLRVVKGTAVYTSSFTPSTTPLTAITNTSLLTCQSNRFIDNSSNAFTITKVGDTSVQRFSPFSPTTAYSTSVNGGSGYFDGSGDYLSVASQTALGMGSGDFTYEAWIYVNEIVPTNALRGLYDSRVSGSTGCGIYTSADSGATSKLVYATNSAIAATSTNTIKPYCWTYVAVTRSSGTVRGFLNGVLEFTVTDSRTFSSSAPTYIGTDVSPQYFNGFINDARILKGTAQYTSAFTPPTAPLTAITNTSLLLNYTNAGILDNAMMNDLETVGNAQISTSVKKYGTGSMYFDGTDDRLNMPSSPNLAFGTGDFTLECWAYFTSTANFPTLTDSRANTSSTAGFNLGLSSAKVQLYTTSQLLIGSSTLSANTWYHIAVTRASGTLKIWLNGVQDATVSNSTNWSDQTFVVGATPNAANFMTGYIDDLRITKAARYTTTFTPPTAAFADKG